MPSALSESAVAQIIAFISGVLGLLPDVGIAKNMMLLGRRMLRAKAVAQVLALSEHNQKMVLRDVNLCLLRADCHKALDESKSEFLAFEQAYRADMQR